MNKNWNKFYIEYHESYEPLTDKEMEVLFNLTEPSDMFDEKALIWGMKRCAKLLEDNGFEGAIKSFEKLFDSREYSKEVIKDEDLL